jgi:hypothetical protein
MLISECFGQTWIMVSSFAFGMVLCLRSGDWSPFFQHRGLSSIPGQSMWISSGQTGAGACFSPGSSVCLCTI